MKKKTPTVIKDGLTGLAIGTAVIVPGISGGTIALVFGAFNKMKPEYFKIVTFF